MPRVVNIPQLLTLKQQIFVKEYINNGGNGTQAALKAYDSNNSHIAENIASENLGKPVIQETITEILTRKGITVDKISENVNSLASAKVEKVSADTKLKANIELLKLYNAYPDKKSYQYSMSIKGNVKDLSYSEAKKQLDAINNDLQDLEAEEVENVA